MWKKAPYIGCQLTSNYSQYVLCVSENLVIINGQYNATQKVCLVNTKLQPYKGEFSGLRVST